MLRCRQCGDIQYLCAQCDDETHQSEPLHDTDLKVKNLDRAFLPIENEANFGFWLPF